MDWIEYLNIWERLSPDMKRVGEMVGVEERFLIRAMRGTINKQGCTSEIRISQTYSSNSGASLMLSTTKRYGISSISASL